MRARRLCPVFARGNRSEGPAGRTKTRERKLSSGFIGRTGQSFPPSPRAWPVNKGRSLQRLRPIFMSKRKARLAARARTHALPLGATASYSAKTIGIMDLGGGLALAQACLSPKEKRLAGYSGHDRELEGFRDQECRLRALSGEEPFRIRGDENYRH